MKKLILLLAIFLFIPLVLGQKPTQSNILTPTQLIIVQPSVEIFKQNEFVEMHFHVYNSSAAILNSSAGEVNCTIHLYNSSNGHIFRGYMDADDDDMKIRINTSKIGIYTFNMFCYAPAVKLNAKEFGYLSSYYYITSEGKSYVPGTSGLTSIATIAGIFAICFLLLYVAFNVDKEKHFILQLLILGFVVVVTILIPKVILDFTNDYSTSLTFYKATIWFIRLFWVYLFFYLLSEMFAPLKKFRVRLK